jgi:hypothetical protein
MKPRLLVLLGLLTGSSMVWGADTRKDLTQARADYRQAVTRHGENSVEAHRARQHLRAARRTFHDERRQKKQ